MHKPFRFILAGAIVAGGMFALACSDDEDNEEAEAEVRAAMAANLEADANFDADGYFATVTDDFMENVFGPFGITEEMVREDPESSLGTTGISADDAEIEVDGDTATALVAQTAEEDSSLSWIEAEFVKEDDVWLLDTYGPADASETPEDASEVDVSLEDFAFDFEEGDFEPGKPVVFNLTNNGDQPHHLVMFALEDDVDLEAALASEGEPEGVTDVGGSFFFKDGESGQFVIQDPLPAGRYAFLCFLTDPPENFEGEPHFQKGMVADFRIE